MIYDSAKFIRIKPFSTLLSRWHTDWRRIPYDLLPLANSNKIRNAIAKILSYNAPKTLDFTPSVHAQALYQQLLRDGFSLDLAPLNANQLETILSYFKNALCHDKFRPELGEFAYDKPVSNETNMGFYSLKDIITAPHILELFNDSDILAAAELYLGCKPLLDNIDAWWSYGGKQHPKGTQRFHRDLDSYRGFKQFIYLTDVGIKEGPHKYIKESHRINKLSTGKACTDEEIYNTFGVENEKSITGTAGTRFIADTYGFHKGSLPIEGNRLILVAQYNINRTPHGPKTTLLHYNKTTEHYDSYINKLLIQFP